jgi:hypothetical protein
LLGLRDLLGTLKRLLGFKSEFIEIHINFISWHSRLPSANLLYPLNTVCQDLLRKTPDSILYLIFNIANNKPPPSKEGAFYIV